MFNFKNHLLLLLSHFYAGDTETTQNILDVLKRHEGKNLEVACMEMAHHQWRDGVHAESSLRSYHELREVLEGLPEHKCEIIPCDICYENFLLLAVADFCIRDKAIEEHIKSIDKLLNIYPDDIMVIFMRGQVWLTHAVDSDEEAAAHYYGRALVDFQRVGQLLETVPDNQIYIFRYNREKDSVNPRFKDDIFQEIDELRFIEAMVKGPDSGQMKSPPFDMFSVPLDLFQIAHKKLSADVLQSMGRFEEAKILLRQALRLAEEAGNGNLELIADVMLSFAQLLTCDENRENLDDAMMLLQSGPEVARRIEDKNFSALLLYFLGEISPDQTEMMSLLKESLNTAKVSQNDELVENLQFEIAQKFPLVRKED